MSKAKTLKTEKVTREMVKNMEAGTSIICVLPSYSSVENARATVGAVRKLTGYNLTCNLTGENIVTITRHE